MSVFRGTGLNELAGYELIETAFELCTGAGRNMPDGSKIRLPDPNIDGDPGGVLDYALLEERNPTMNKSPYSVPSSELDLIGVDNSIDIRYDIYTDNNGRLTVDLKDPEKMYHVIDPRVDFLYIEGDQGNAKSKTALLACAVSMWGLLGVDPNKPQGTPPTPAPDDPPEVFTDDLNRFFFGVHQWDPGINVQDVTLGISGGYAPTRTDADADAICAAFNANYNSGFQEAFVDVAVAGFKQPGVGQNVPPAQVGCTRPGEAKKYIHQCDNAEFLPDLDEVYHRPTACNTKARPIRALKSDPEVTAGFGTFWIGGGPVWLP